MIRISDALIKNINNEVLREAENIAEKSYFIPASDKDLQDLDEAAFFLALVRVGGKHLTGASDNGQRDATRP